MTDECTLSGEGDFIKPHHVPVEKSAHRNSEGGEDRPAATTSAFTRLPKTNLPYKLCLAVGGILYCIFVWREEVRVGLERHFWRDLVEY